VRPVGAGGMMSDQTVAPRSAASEDPIALIALTASRTPFAGPLPGVVMSQTATAQEVVEITVPVTEVTMTS